MCLAEVLHTHLGGALCSVQETDGWEVVEMLVDSGASESVVPPHAVGGMYTVKLWVASGKNQCQAPGEPNHRQHVDGNQ